MIGVLDSILGAGFAAHSAAAAMQQQQQMFRAGLWQMAGFPPPAPTAEEIAQRKAYRRELRMTRHMEWRRDQIKTRWKRRGVVFFAVTCGPPIVAAIVATVWRFCMYAIAA